MESKTKKPPEGAKARQVEKSGAKKTLEESETYKKLKDSLEGIAEPCLILITSDSTHYSETAISALKIFLNEKNMDGVYVTVSRPYKVVTETLDREGFDAKKIVFIDMVSKKADWKLKDSSEVKYMQSSLDLEGLMRSLNTIMTEIPGEGKNTFLFLDTLSSLLVGNPEKAVSRFMLTLTAKIRLWEISGVIISLEAGLEEELLNLFEGFCDKTINILD